MKMYNVQASDGSGYYSTGYWDRSDALELLEICQTHDPAAQLVEYEVKTEEEILRDEIESLNQKLADAAPKWHDARKEPPEEYTEGLLVIVSGQPHPNVEFKNALQIASYAPGEGWIIEGWGGWEDPDVSWWQIPQLPEGIEVMNK